MKHVIFLLICALVCLYTSAQPPMQINYQGIARNSSGNTLTNENLSVRLSIRESTPTGSITYQETRSIKTDKFGMFVIAIGSSGASNVVSSLGGVGWAAATSKYLQVEIAPKNSNNYLDMGTAQLLSVPFAIAAESARPVGVAGGSLTGAYPNPSIGTDAISATNILDSSITANKLAPGVISTSNSAGGNAGGDLTGIFPNPSIAKLKGRDLSSQAPFAGQVLKFDGTQWAPGADNMGNITVPFIASQSSAFTLFSIVNQGNGAGLSGTNISQNPNVYGVIGKISSTSPGNLSAGVRAVNNGTGATGYGVWASHSGSGPGVFATSINGAGVNAFSESGYGLSANSNTGTGIFATSNEGIPALVDISNPNSFNDAVFASNAGYGNGVTAVANYGYGVLGIANDTYGTGLLGINNAGGEAILGFTISDNGSAVVGRNDGSYAAVRGFNTSNNGVGVLALANSWGATDGTALVAELEGANPGNTAVFKANNANVARIDGQGKGFFNGGTQMGGADIAEYFRAEGKRDEYEPGDVLIISKASDRSIEKSFGSYSNLVAGVYATKPGVLLTEENAEKDELSAFVPMGVIGVLPTKVCNEGGAIQRGDLLVTSSIPGIAMKADLEKVRVGQVIGKALETYSGNKISKINVLVSVK